MQIPGSRLLMLTIAATLAATAGGGVEDPILDPVVEDVLRLLDDGLAADTISDWLSHHDVRPGRLTADDLLALHRAGAPESLIQELVALGATSGHRRPPGASARSVLAIEVTYRPVVEEAAESWDLLVYVDGLPVAWTAGGWNPRLSGATRVQVPVAAGGHVVRLLQEKHVRQGGDRWRHEARVFPQPVTTQVGPGERWLLEVEVSELGRVARDPAGAVSWRVERDGTLVGEEQHAGGPTHTWPLLCEEVLSRFPPPRRASTTARRAARGCVGWGDLWSPREVPDRAAVRELLAAHDFRPVAGE
jgi:hypothetical protein